MSFSAARDVAVAGGLAFTGRLWLAHLPFYDEFGIVPGDVGLAFGDVLERSIDALLSLVLLTPVMAYSIAIFAFRANLAAPADDAMPGVGPVGAACAA